MHAGRLALVILIVVASLTTATLAQTTHYIDPVNGSPAGDGTDGNPWRTLEEVIAANLIETTSSGVYVNFGAPIKGGDTVVLRSGFHGEVFVEHYFNTDMITFVADDGHTPSLSRIYMGGCRNWTFRGLTISPSLGPTTTHPTLDIGTWMVSFYSRFGIGVSQNMVVEDCTMYTVDDASGFSASQWVNAWSGVSLGYEGRLLTARNNVIRNVRFGIVFGGEDCVAEGNQIINFSGDGMRVTNHGATVQYNLIKNCYNVDDNHDDGIQGYRFYTSMPDVHDVILRGNVIINREDPAQPFQGSLQAIGCFDGPLVDWIVENNVILVDHWHGITLFSASGCRVVNNTVFNPWYHSGPSNMGTWIQVWGSGPTNLIRNNIAHDYESISNSVVDHNITIAKGQDISGWFVDEASFDMRLLAGSPAIDAGASTDVPDIDADQFFRPIGGLWDIGAFEYGSMPAASADAGADATIIDADDNGIEVVMLDGSGSYCLNGTITEYLWTRDGSYVGTGASVPGILALGDNTFVLRVTTSTGEQVYDEVTYTVESGSTPTPGDADGDDDVDLDDFVILKQNFGTPSGATQADGDFDGDGDVDLDDFVILKQNFGS